MCLLILLQFFFHELVITYENRPFATAEEMNQHMIQNWNRVVKRLDKVYVLGDFSFHPKEHIKALCEALNGYKILIMGNHDTVSHRFYLENGFNEVSKYPVLLDNTFLLSHRPIPMTEDSPFVNVFGHVHGTFFCFV